MELKCRRDLVSMGHVVLPKYQLMAKGVEESINAARNVTASSTVSEGVTMLTLQYQIKALPVNREAGSINRILKQHGFRTFNNKETARKLH